MSRIERFSGEYHFLSNFYPHPIQGAHGLVYPTAEAAFHGGKTTTLGERAWIAAAPTPSVAKRRGRLVALRADWDQHRHIVMRAVLHAKFTDPYLANRLLTTDDTVLIEGTIGMTSTGDAAVAAARRVRNRERTGWAAISWRYAQISPRPGLTAPRPPSPHNHEAGPLSRSPVHPLNPRPEPTA
jgi:predicted NAD-dependent protein-ADP-ribosyltransferase YbiA (DUF1768 family)